MKNKLQLLLTIFLLNIANTYSQCGCDVNNCMTEFPNVTLFNVYYGDNITLNAPPLPTNHVGTSGYAWFTVTTKTTNDPNSPSQGYLSPFINGQITNSYTFNPLDRLSSNPTPTEGYFMCRTSSKASSSSSANCFYGRSFKVVFNAVPAPILTVSQNLSICSGESITLTATNTVGSLIWRENSITGNIVGTGNSISVSPSGTTTYVVYANNGSSGQSPAGITNSQSVSTTVTVTTPPVTPTILQNGNVLHSSSANGNQWYNQNGIINGATNQDYTPLISGSYYVTTSSSGCSSTSSTFNYASLSNASFDINNGIKVYPNPTSSNISIDLGNNSVDGLYNVKITNTLGQEIYNSELNKQQSTIELKKYAKSGLYIISILDEVGTVLSINKIILN